MKKFEFLINKSSLNIFFPHYRIKTKAHIIEILMETLKYMLLNPEIKEENSFGKIVLIVLNDGANNETFNIKYNDKVATTSLSANSVATYIF